MQDQIAYSASHTLSEESKYSHSTTISFCDKHLERYRDGEKDYLLGLKLSYGMNEELIDLEKARLSFQKAARKQHPIALYYLGIAYINGRGVEKNPIIGSFQIRRSLENLKIAAKDGDPDAQFCLGHLNENGLDICQIDIQKAIYWYQKSASQGHADAQYHLARIYSLESYPDIDIILYWYRKSAHQGHAEAQFFLGLAHWNAKGWLNNPEEAIRWIEKSAAQDYLLAEKHLGQMYVENINIPEFNNTSTWLESSAEKNDPDALFNLGRFYAERMNRSFNIEKAIQCYRLAAKQGHIEAQKALGRIYEKRIYNGYNKSIGRFQYFKEAEKWYKEAANQNDPEAQIHLASLYANSNGHLYDIIRLYTAAAKQGHEEAQIQLALLYENDKTNLVQSDKKAVFWYRKAAEKNNKLALQKLGGKYQKLMKNGCAEAQNKLGEMYYHGLVVKKDRGTAFNLFQIAAKKGNVKAQRNMAKIYWEEASNEKEVAEGEKWCRKAANQGDLEAQKELLNLYSQFPADGYLEKAIKVLEQLAEQEQIQALMVLGEKYYWGDGVAQDPKKASRYFLKAAKKHYAAAQRMIGEISGDPKQAIHYLKMAAMQHDLEAQEHLSKRYFHGEGVEKDLFEGMRWFKKSHLSGTYSEIFIEGGWKDNFFSDLIKRLEENDPTLTSLDLHHLPIDDEVILPLLLNALKKNRYIKTINFSDTEITIKGLYKIVDFLLENESVTHIELDGNHVGIQGDYIIDDVIIPFLKHRRGEKITETVINISNCESDAVHRMVLSNFDNYPNLEFLYLNGLNKRDGFFLPFIEYLKKNPLLKVLDLSNNQVTHSTLYALSAAMVTNRNLKFIELCNNHIQVTSTILENCHKECEQNPSLIGISLTANFLNSGCQPMLMSPSTLFYSSHKHLIIKSILKPSKVIEKKGYHKIWMAALLCRKDRRHAILMLEGFLSFGQKFLDWYEIETEGGTYSKTTVTSAKSYNFYDHIFDRDKWYIDAYPINNRQIDLLMQKLGEEQIAHHPFTKIPLKAINAIRRIIGKEEQVNCTKWCTDIMQYADIPIPDTIDPRLAAKNGEPDKLSLPDQVLLKTGCS